MIYLWSFKYDRERNTNPGKREISRDSFQYSLDGYKCLEDLLYLTKYFSC